MANVNKIEVERIENELRLLGFTAKEARIYFDIYMHGAGSVQDIARRLHLNRVTVHSAVEQLLAQQFLSESREGKRRTLFVESIERLKESVEASLQDALRARETADQLTKQLEGVQRVSYAPPEVYMYQGIRGYRQFLDDILDAKREVRIFVDIDRLEEILTSEYLFKYYRKRAARNIHTKMIWPDCPFARKLKKKEQEYKIRIRCIKRMKNWQVGFYSWNDKLGITCFVEGHVVCTVIRNGEIASFYQKTIYDSLWEMLG